MNLLDNYPGSDTYTPVEVLDVVIEHANAAMRTEAAVQCCLIASGGCWCGGRKLVIGRADRVFAVFPFPPAHGEMGSRNLLKVVDEYIIHRRPAQCADDWYSLRRKLLTHNNAESAPLRGT